MTKKTYLVKASCYNCQEHSTLELEYGKQFKNERCPYCGCSTLYKLLK